MKARLFLSALLLSASVMNAQQLIGTGGDIYVQNPPSPHTTEGVYIVAKSGTPGIGAKLGGTTGSFTIFNSADGALLSVSGTGRVAIGTSGPVHRLQVLSTADAEAAVYGTTSATIEANTNQNDSAVTGLGYQIVQTGMHNTGYVTGVRARGALNGPGEVDDVYSVFADFGTTTNATTTGVVNNATGLYATTLLPAGKINNAYGVHIAALAATVSATGVRIEDMNDSAGQGYGIHQLGDDDKNLFLGMIQIGTGTPAPTTEKLYVYGNAHFTGTVTGGNIQAKYQDVAEWVPSTTDLAPGTVVVLNTAKNNEVMISGTAYDSTVAGVVSAQPGLSLGEAGEGKEQIATTGRVKVRVDANRGAIKVGDLLVTSDLPGTAMKSEPMVISGRRFHQPGTIIGKALEPLAKGTGEILVLLSMQ
ncbi:MAG TPA: hypothetical protein VEU30_01500 [Thermoanaerobaculia bacterium]|nr:hypothetical protein [Thermoanaerobaculia bacterium]